MLVVDTTMPPLGSSSIVDAGPSKTAFSNVMAATPVIVVPSTLKCRLPGAAVRTALPSPLMVRALSRAISSVNTMVPATSMVAPGAAALTAD